MSEPFVAKVTVVESNDTGEIAEVAPLPLRQTDVDQIANLTNQIVINLQNNLQVTPKEEAPNKLAISEIELSFGIDFEVEAKTEVKVPIIGPVVGGAARAGATFEIHLKLSRINS